MIARRKGVAVVFGWVSMGSPSGLRSFDPVGIADLEYRMWVAYYLRRWRNLLAASVRLLWLGFGTDLARILPGAWLMLRAVQLWAPFPDNDSDGAQARMRELYGLVRLRFGEPADPARAGRPGDRLVAVYRRRQYAPHPAETGDELAEREPACTATSSAIPQRWSGQPLRTECGRWICPTSGSEKGAEPTARCSRWNAPRWSAPTLRCAPPAHTYSRRRIQARVAQPQTGGR